MNKFLKEFKDRGFFYQCTSEDELSKLLDEEKINGYIGFDCTAESLHVGSLLQIMCLRLLQKHGHRPIVLLGGVNYYTGQLFDMQAITAAAHQVGALAGYGLGDIVSNEMQRSRGALLNPNEFVQYTNTQLRTFTFNWTILPDSEYESMQATGLIKFFRKSAHAKKNNQITLTVPDHCIVSFHGAKDMIQLPPCVIESVGVTYNPNTTSFFKQNNAPVEIGLTVGLKEMVPIYNDDVEMGY